MPDDEPAADSSKPRDRFGNLIDPEVKYARGRILASARDERLRFLHAQRLIRRRLGAGRPIAIFTGNQREFLLDVDDLSRLAEEWLGPAQFDDELRAEVLGHLGGSGEQEIAIFNRTSGGLIAAISTIAEQKTVISFVPSGSTSHPSIVRGARAGQSELCEIQGLEALEHSLAGSSVGLVVITAVSSELQMLSPAQLREAVALARRHGVLTLIDDAYGARLRPVVQSGPRSLELGADLAITSADKAGLGGPRAGFMAGRADLVLDISTRSSQSGQEARAPIALAVLRSLQRYDPATLMEEIANGEEVYAELSKLLPGRVHLSPIGALMTEDEILTLALERAGLPPAEAPLVPCEAASALGMFLLEDSGILVIVAGQPGARVSLRLKPVPGAVEMSGGAAQVARAVDEAFFRLAAQIRDDPDGIRELIVGDPAQDRVGRSA